MISRTLNVGLAEARGKYVVRMDADDISLPRRLEIQWKYMEAHPEVGVAGGVMQLMDENGQDLGRRIYHQEDREIRQHLFRYSPFSHPTIILRKAVLDKCGGYDPQYDLAEDYELYFRLGRVAKFGNVPDTLLRYRVAKKSLTAQVARRMELKTLEIRRKAATDYGYTPTPGDRLYGFLQWLSIFLIPVKLKKAVFTWWRSF
jgi:glycosyltransferase involved in cell wall biosynthesis